MDLVNLFRDPTGGSERAGAAAHAASLWLLVWGAAERPGGQRGRTSPFNT